MDGSKKNKIVSLSVSELADGIRNREFTSLEVVTAFFTQIELHNDKLIALVTLNKENAIERAKEADLALSNGINWGPLHGVPFTVKDSLSTKGIRTTSNHKPLTNYIPEKNAVLVERMLNAGAILLGKENLPELAGDAQAIGPLFGQTSNPYDLSRTPGGSTSGGAAAVAAFLSPISLGTSIGGSVEMPSSYCGVFGFKPSEGVAPLQGHIPPIPGTAQFPFVMPSPGWLTRSMDDLELGLQIMGGYAFDQVLDAWSAPITLGKPTKDKNTKFRLCWSTNFKYPIDGQIMDPFKKAIDKLNLKFDMTNQDFPLATNIDDHLSLWGELFVTMIQISSPNFLMRTALKVMSYIDKSPVIQGEAKGAWSTLHTFGLAIQKRNEAAAQVDEFLRNFDAFICPVTFSPAFTKCKTGTTQKIVDEKGNKYDLCYWINCIGITCLMNLSGVPTVVLPLGLSPSGLPIGIMIVGRKFSDVDLLVAARVISETLGCSHVAPKGFL
eukprot:TRINITY_DN3342_c0_g1_i4.p1 TRINITY_DN3342_c0_g1~~TRINITY_DN3342_c0_g1_i4.p1  ORF type:complete len:496 (+),score=91.73 TRINITY_DN3342_c0_g1_i4:61-1548(+)